MNFMTRIISQNTSKISRHARKSPQSKLGSGGLFEASLVYRASSRTAGQHRETLSQKPKPKKEKGKKKKEKKKTKKKKKKKQEKTRLWCQKPVGYAKGGRSRKIMSSRPACATH